MLYEQRHLAQWVQEPCIYFPYTHRSSAIRVVPVNVALFPCVGQTEVIEHAPPWTRLGVVNVSIEPKTTKAITAICLIKHLKTYLTQKQAFVKKDVSKWKNSVDKVPDYCHPHPVNAPSPPA